MAWTTRTRQLIKSQELIGWTNLIRGFFAKEWNDLLLSKITPNTQIKGHTNTFFSNLIVSLWNKQTAFWMSYQEKRHATPPNPNEDAEKQPN
jgi:hypothetical protein